ncbi:Fanconi anaemia protein FANCD2 [Lobosporangium transversale]|uniref:Fanconi anaemia protein FANCD2 n=1 Tax=Lobosporangium transversale TaxID=64571 RepID=A0A1Y2H0M5_9FUNG|nr:Fanconi anaemia protein FANCD2 [Lobosporangium transversale]ORZ28109.1 Fanconi anaemia protein FANCD2 [Lobosporangium transversale]|eukprot:XP_021885794.1 Fanconi anaemia protein FANCD2 [Lobosporangium transversale]
MTLTVGPTVFYAICQEAGLVLGMNGSPNMLNVEPPRFQRDTARLIQRNYSGSDCVESFLEGLQEHLEKPQNLRACLLPISSSSAERISSFSLNESLIRILLGIDILQPGLMEALLDQIFGFLNDDEIDSPIPKLILQQLKWLNNIIEPGKLSAKLLEVIGLSSQPIQRDIITSLPEIIPDSEHRAVVLGLVELMENSSELMVPILDALSNLNLQSDILVNARNHVMNKLESAELDDLPIVIKFLLQTVEPETVEDVIEAIRANLDFGSINKLQKNVNQKSKRASNQTPEVLILDALKTGIRFQKFVTDAWYKALANIVKSGQYKVIDIMVILILHSIVNLKKKIEVLIRKKIIDGLLTRKLLSETIMIHGISLREYMPAVLSISENLLRSSGSHPIVARTASTLYTSAFQVSDIFYRQEIVGSLLVHIGSGSSVEIDASLAVLQNIVRVSRAALNEYSAFIKGVLDYLDNLSLEQIRQFYLLLGSLAREDETSANSGTLLNDLHILIRKQLSNPIVRFKKIGVMGAIAMVQAFGVKESAQSGRGSSSQAVTSHRQAESDPLLKISVSYLQMIRDSCQKSSVCLALTYDELASMVIAGNLDPKLVFWIKEEFSDQFAGTFVFAANEVFTMRPSRNIAMERWMNLDGPESELSIGIMPSLCADIAESSQSAGFSTEDTSVYLCSLFKLLQATEKSGENGLDDIDGLLGCGITMFKREYFEDVSEVYSIEICHMIAQGLLCAINWFREISNAFSFDASDQTMARIIIRLQQISELERMFRHVLKSVPGFRPLEASQAAAKDVSRGTVPMSLSIQPVSSNAMGKMSTRAMDIDQPQKPFTVHSSEIVTYESLSPYLREFEMDVFHVLRVHKPITREIFEISEITQDKNVQLQYPELLFLLKDLHAKIMFKLPLPVTNLPFGKKPQPPVANNLLLVRMNTFDFVRNVLLIIPHVATKSKMMLETLHHEEEVRDQNGEMVDHSIIMECLNVSLKVLQSLLSWNEIKASDQKELRLELLKSLALDELSEEQKASVQKSVNLSAMAVQAFNNLSAWRKMMPNFECSTLLIEIIDKLLSLVPVNSETSTKASALATDVLSYRWPASNNIKPDRLAYVLSQQIGKSDMRLAMINEYVTKVLPSFLDQDEGHAELHPLLTTSTFTTYTKALHTQLALLVGEFDEEKFDNTQAAFDHISDLCLCFQQLAAFVKSNDKREVLGVTLKHSKVFMEQFIKRILPFLGVHFRGHQDTVARIFKNHLQPATRSLQNVCGHAKASREQALMAMVPSIKKTMEGLIFEVKLMLETNDAGAAFWLGNLKHRNLRGEEISSQLPAVSDEESDHDQSIDEQGDGDTASNDDVAQTNSRKKRARGGTSKPLSSTRAKNSKEFKKAVNTNSKDSRAKSKKSAATTEDEDVRIHTKSQITNSDMSEDEQDQLVNEDESDIGIEKRRRKAPRIQVEDRDDEDEAVGAEEVDELDDDDEDQYDARMLEVQEERAERRRRVRNPFIDDAASEGDEEEDEEEEEEEEEEGEDLDSY